MALTPTIVWGARTNGSALNGPASQLTRVDELDQIFTYHCDLHVWEQSGVLYDKSIVSPNNDGLVTPNIVKLLENVGDIEFKGFKLSPTAVTTSIPQGPQSSDVYWYLLKAGKFITIRPNGQDVQVEIASNSLTHYLYSLACKGPKGTKGETGLSGINGLPGPVESTYATTVIDGLLIIDVPVLTPLDTPISLRLSNQLINKDLEIRVDLDGKWTQISGLKVELDSVIVLDRLGKHFLAKLHRLDQPWELGWYAKVRQVGLAGDAGIDGSGFLTINSAAYSKIQSLSAVQTIAKNGFDLQYIVGPQLQFSVNHLRANSDISFVRVNDAINLLGTKPADLWVAVDATIGPGRALKRWGFDPAPLIKAADNTGGSNNNEYVDVVLNLPTWEPLKVVGFAGWQGFPAAEQIPVCAEDLFIAIDRLVGPPCGSSSSESGNHGGDSDDKVGSHSQQTFSSASSYSSVSSESTYLYDVQSSQSSSASSVSSSGSSYSSGSSPSSKSSQSSLSSKSSDSSSSLSSVSSHHSSMSSMSSNSPSSMSSVSNNSLSSISSYSLSSISSYSPPSMSSVSSNSLSSISSNSLSSMSSYSPPSMSSVSSNSLSSISSNSLSSLSSHHSSMSSMSSNSLSSMSSMSSNSLSSMSSRHPSQSSISSKSSVSSASTKSASSASSHHPSQSSVSSISSASSLSSVSLGIRHSSSSSSEPSTLFI